MCPIFFAVFCYRKVLFVFGDIIYAEVSGGAEQYAEHFTEVDGHRLCPIVKYYKVPRQIMEASKQRILF